MNEDKESKNKNTIFGGLTNSIWNIFKSPTENVESIDLDDKKSKKIDLNKIKYNESILNDLKREKNKRNYENDKIDNLYDNKNIKRAKLNISHTNDSEKSINIDFNKPTFNYRNICDKSMKEINNIDNNIDFSRVNSIQSLSESIDPCYQSATASRISANIFSYKPSQLNNEIMNKTANSSSIFNKTATQQSFRTRRYKIVTKRDKFSSYLSRESLNNDDTDKNDVLNQSSFINASLSFDLPQNKTDETSKRFDLSQFRNITSDKKTEQWCCNQCQTLNPINFNFCPTCSNPNPLNISSQLSSVPSVPVDISSNEWKCLRCSGLNYNERKACAFCFLIKDTKVTQHNPIKSRASTLAKEKISSLFDKIENSNNNTKWNCPTCMVDNVVEEEFCVCCKTKNPNGKAAPSIKSIPFDNINKSESVKPLNTFTFGKLWQCPICLIENKPNLSECVACCTKNPTSNSPITFGSIANWQCPICLIENKRDAPECVACSTSNPNGNKSAQSSSSISFGTKKSIEMVRNSQESCKIKFGQIEDRESVKNQFKSNNNGALSMFTSSSVNKWQCPTCLVENRCEVTECGACNTENPNNKKAAQLSASISFGSKNSIETGNSNQSIKFGTFQSLKPNENKPNFNTIGSMFTNSLINKWECPICLVENKLEVSECVACSAKNPNRSQDSQLNSSISFGSLKSTTFANTSETTNKSLIFNSTSIDKWQCPICLIENKRDVPECVACYTKNPNVDKNKESNSPISFGTKQLIESEKNQNQQTSKIQFGQTKEKEPLKLFNFGTNQYKSNNNNNDALSILKSSPIDKWQCSTCLIENKCEATECVACCAKNPNNKNKVELSTPVSFGSKKSIESEKNQNQETSKIQFGQTKEKEPLKLFNFGTNQYKSNNDNSALSILKSSSMDKWQCSTCLIENKCEATECIACCAKNPNNKQKSQLSTSVSFGSIKSTELLQNKLEETPQIKFGNVKNSTFVFGNNENKTEENKIDSSFKMSNGTADNCAPSFSFGENIKSGAQKSLEIYKSDSIEFVFSKPEHLDIGSSQAELESDMDFVFSSAESV